MFWIRRLRMNNSNKTINADSNNIKTTVVIIVICVIVLVVFGFYFAYFHNGLSEKNEVWGTFGDYFGGILNPVIAAFALYLIVETYKLQKQESKLSRDALN
jgi:large-conductance mechanosensitive channel